MEEDITDLGLQGLNQEKGKVEEPPQFKEKATRLTKHNRGERAVRQSERIKEQGMGDENCRQSGHGDQEEESGR
jgi:hypothetical protein